MAPLKPQGRVTPGPVMPSTPNVGKLTRYGVATHTLRNHLHAHAVRQHAQAAQHALVAGVGVDAAYHRGVHLDVVEAEVVQTAKAVNLTAAVLDADTAAQRLERLAQLTNDSAGAA